MRFMISSFLLLLSSLALADVQIDIKRLSDKAIEVSYIPSQSCPALTLEKSGKDDKHLRENWRSTSPCATLDGDTIRFSGQSCKRATFTVPVSTEIVRQYYPAFPMAGGVYIHTTNYVVDDHCGPMHYTLKAPAVAAEGRIQAKQATLAWDNRDHTAAILLPKVPPKTQGVPVWIDPALPASTQTLIRDVGNGTMDYLRAQMPDAPFHMPIVAAASIQNGGTTRVDGNGGDILRLALYNWPASPDQDARDQTTHLVSHESGHESQVFLDESQYPDERLIHEGGAEFMQWMVRQKYGWLSKDAAAEYLNDALGDCLLATGDLPWAKVDARTKGSNRLAYRCGLPVYVLAMAAGHAQETPFQRINAFYVGVRSGASPNFAQVLECGNTPNCESRWTQNLLGSQTAMRDAFAQVAQETGLLKASGPAQAQINSMITSAIGELMREDCGFRNTYWSKDGLLLEGSNNCAHLNGKFVVQSISGQSLYVSDKALNSLVQSCVEKHNVTLEMKDNSTVTVACGHPFQPLQAFYRVDIDRVLELLKL